MYIYIEYIYTRFQKRCFFKNICHIYNYAFVLYCIMPLYCIVSFLSSSNASFRNIASRNSTELSKYVWSLKDNNINHVITWQIIARAKPYNSASKRCNLCLLEEFIIIREPHRCTLNKRNELVSGCRHRKKSLQRSN